MYCCTADEMVHPKMKLFDTQHCGISPGLDRIGFGKKATLFQFPW